jgi:hypothetical protein
MWKVTENKAANGQQDLRVKILLKEIAQYDHVHTASNFEAIFKKEVQEIPAKNNFSASLMYKIKALSDYEFEVWKMTTAGDFKSKMCVITKS